MKFCWRRRFWRDRWDGACVKGDFPWHYTLLSYPFVFYGIFPLGIMPSQFHRTWVVSLSCSRSYRERQGVDKWASRKSLQDSGMTRVRKAHILKLAIYTMIHKHLLYSNIHQIFITSLGIIYPNMRIRENSYNSVLNEFLVWNF